MSLPSLTFPFNLRSLSNGKGLELHVSRMTDFMDTWAQHFNNKFVVALVHHFSVYIFDIERLYRY